MHFLSSLFSSSVHRSRCDITAHLPMEYVRTNPMGTTWDGSSGRFFVISKSLFCFVVAIFDLVRDVEAIHDLW